jgi:2-oxoisovalerate dehydrogenase E2 component (dihydrolipoyl transacylase)
MGNYVFKLPDVGEGIAQAEIVAWHVELGQLVREDQPLVDVMTDKATVEISSPVSGRILSLNGEAGKMVAIGEELVVIEMTDEAGQPRRTIGAPKAPPQLVEGPPPSAAASVAVTAPPRYATGRPGKVQAAPAVRARASTLGIDLAAVPGSGPEGRVRHEDLDRMLLHRREALPVPVPDGTVEEIKVIGLRRQIAQRMQESKRRIPHFSYVEEVDVTALEALRSDLNASIGEGKPRITLLPFLIRAIVGAVASNPALNAHFDDEAAVIRRYTEVHAGVATQTPRGLVVPVVKRAQARDLWDIASEIVRLSEAARAGKATRDELTGSTITVSSLGALGGIMATPIINPPEVAIVGVNRIVERPVVRDGRIAIARIMNLSSSFDHRVVDGFDAAAFIRDVKGELEAPGRLLLP